MQSTKGNGGAKSQKGFSNDERSLQELLTMGEQANQLLQNPAYNVAYRMQMDQIIQQWLTSDPKHSNFREGLFHQARGLMDSAHRLGGMVNEAKQILQNQGSEADPERTRNDYLNEQGYGLDFANN